MAIIPIMKKEISALRPCAKCKKVPTAIESIRYEGRQRDNYRIVCECGNGPLQWSINESAAVRLWNGYSAV